MSRRHTSNSLAHAVARAIAATLTTILLVAAVLPATASAQQNRIRDVDIEQRWQLLTYLPAGARNLQPIPAGVGATLLLSPGNRVLGQAGCSDFETTYSRQRANLFFVPPEPDYVDCDPALLEFDEDFYRLLADTASIEVGREGSILTLKDAINRSLMVLTRARIDDDPTVARWNLARIGEADGSIELVIVGLEPWVEFLRGGSVVGRSACGSFLGSYTTNEGTIDITDLRFRLRDDCTEAARSQAARTIETLSEISRFEVLPAGLALQDENGTTRLAFTPDLSLGRRIWTPTVIYDRNEEARFEGDELSTSAVQFNRQDAQGRSICRPFIAQSLRSGLALNVDDDTIQYLFEGCPRNDAVDWTGIERAFMNALKDAASHALRGSELELKDVDGKTLMKLEPQADLVGTTWVVTRLGNNRLRAPTGDNPLSATFDEIGLVFGDTGATVESFGSNYYQTFYETPQATRIKIESINLRRDVEGRACNGANGKRKQTPACKQEALFLKLLSQVDGYIVRDEILQLLKGNRVVVRLEPEPFANAGDVE